MFSGGDSSDGINSANQFSSFGFVNQVTVSNAMAAGQNIDWAQLAQQWIQMRDNSELDPRTELEHSANKAAEPNILKFEEKGEADMDMDEEEHSDEKIQRFNSLGTSSNSTDNLHQSWYFDGNNPELDNRASCNNQWNPWQNHETSTTSLPTKNRSANSTAHIPSLLKMSVPNPNEIRVMSDISVQPDNTNVMDAVKKKVLPAWIREGLEKMEREKQKLLEKEHQSKDINSSDEDKESNTVKRNKPKAILLPPAIDDGSSDIEDSIIVKETSERDTNLKETNDKEDDNYTSISDKTYEQRLAELMIVVRHTLTELLLEATNEEIAKVADETIKIFKSKASSAQVIPKSALSTLTGKLGLAAYDDCSSATESENDESYLSKRTSDQSESGNDSEEEIRSAIRLKRRAFIKISEEIEERVMASAVQEEEKLKYFLRKEEQEREHSRRKKERLSAQDSSNSGHIGHNNFKGYEKDFGEITETKIQHINGKRQMERGSRRERITRFSDNKDKSTGIPNAATFLTNLNSATNFISGNNTSALATNSHRQNVPDINGLLPNYASIGMANSLSAADAALEKALKGKTSTSLVKQSQRHERDRAHDQSRKRCLNEKRNSRSRSKTSHSSTSSSSSSTSSDSTSISSRSSNRSKCKRRSAKKHKSYASDARRSAKSSRDHRDRHKYASRSSYKKKYGESGSRGLRNASSDSEDDYRRHHRNESNYSRNLSQKRSNTSSSRYDRDREHSRSHSRSSYSSNNRRQ